MTVDESVYAYSFCDAWVRVPGSSQSLQPRDLLKKVISTATATNNTLLLSLRDRDLDAINIVVLMIEMIVLMRIC